MEGVSEGSRVRVRSRVRVSRVRVVAGSKKGFTFRELTRLQSPPLPRDLLRL